MKYLNGQVCKKPYRKIMLVVGIVLLGISLLLSVPAISTAINGDWEAFSPFLVFSVICFTPGLVLFIIGVVKKAKISKAYRNMLNVDYETWRAEHLSNPRDPLFSVHCSRCNGLIEYDLKGIDGTRAWFPDGYVVCPKCNTTMRHNAARAVVPAQPQSPAPRTCPHCGGVLPPNAHFCSKCGNKV